MNTSYKNKRLLKRILFVVVLMFGFSFLMVPMYNWVSRAAGVNGKLNEIAKPSADCGGIDTTRKITIEVSTSLHAFLNFQFIPLVKRLNIFPGQIAHLKFYVKNNTGQNILVQCLSSVAPGPAARAVKLLKSFCLAQHYLRVGEAVKWPVTFYVDPMLPDYVKVLVFNFTLTNANRSIKQRPKLLQNKYRI